VLRNGAYTLMGHFAKSDDVRITDNRMGWSSRSPHEINMLFAKYVAGCFGPVLDIGAGFGAATLAALSAGAAVVANDIDGEALGALYLRTTPALRQRLELRVGRFPHDLQFPADYFTAIHASNVLHFLLPSDLEVGIRRIREWLLPGGKVFAMVNSAYIENFKEYIPIFEKKKADGEHWPGWIDDLSRYSSHPTLRHLPKQIHVFDAEILARAFSSCGFIVEEAMEIRRTGLPPQLRFDGRENILVVARK
jgi:SAM-dependent methyltransferase